VEGIRAAVQLMRSYRLFYFRNPRKLKLVMALFANAGYHYRWEGMTPSPWEVGGISSNQFAPVNSSGGVFSENENMK
jgi:hypothetical protein